MTQPAPVTVERRTGPYAVALVGEDNDRRRQVAEVLRDSGYRVVLAASNCLAGTACAAEVDAVVTSSCEPPCHHNKDRYWPPFYAAFLLPTTA